MVEGVHAGSGTLRAVSGHVFPARAALPLLLLLTAVVTAQDAPPAAEPAPVADPAKDPAPAVVPSVPVAVGERPADTIQLTPLRSGKLADAVALTSAQADGKLPQAIVFWSPTCPVCRRYDTVLERLRETAGDRAIVSLVAVGGSAEDVTRVLGERKLTLPTALDAGGEAARALGVRVTPTVVLLNAAGVLRYRGPLDDDRRARGRDARDVAGSALAAVLDGRSVDTADVRAFGSALR